MFAYVLFRFHRIGADWRRRSATSRLRGGYRFSGAQYYLHTRRPGVRASRLYGPCPGPRLLHRHCHRHGFGPVRMPGVVIRAREKHNARVTSRLY
jgi:hypothetical protein